MDPFGNSRKPPIRVVGSLFLSWVHEVIRNEEVAVIFLKEFWPRIVGDQLAKSTAPLRLRKRTLEIGWDRAGKQGRPPRERHLPRELTA